MMKCLKHDTATPIFLSLVIFGVLYWIAAIVKPYHGHEFYTLAYTEKSTFLELILLRDGGIGHPPLYHILHKAIQVLFPSYSPILVRLPNFLIGSVFIVVLVHFLQQYRNTKFFFYGIASSACVLHTFVFSRMWGLVCLCSLLLLWSGERFIRSPIRKNFALFVAIFILGVLSDYNFILLVPYALVVTFHQKRYLTPLVYSGTVLLIMSWFASNLFSHAYVRGNGAGAAIYHVLNDLIRICQETGNLLFNYWFVETFLIALSMAAILVAADLKRTRAEFHSRNEGASHHHNIILTALAIAAVGSLIRVEILSVGHGSILMLACFVFLAVRVRIPDFRFADCQRDRMLFAIVGGVLTLLTISPLFWTALTEQRFIIVLLPLLILYVYRVVGDTVLRPAAAIMAVSGLLAVTSYGVMDLYPPPSFEKEEPVIFADVYSYATQYIERHETTGSEAPIIVDTEKFSSSCRVCAFETSDVASASFESDTVWFIGEHDSNPSSILPADFELSSVQLNLSFVDEIQLRYMTPLRPRHYALFEFFRTTRSQQNH